MLKRPSNLPRAELVALATRRIDEFGGPELVRVWFKFDCSSCGSRETAPKPNDLPRAAVCRLCGAETTIEAGGIALQIRAGVDVPWDSSVAVIRPTYASDKGDA